MGDHVAGAGVVNGVLETEGVAPEVGVVLGLAGALPLIDAVGVNEGLAVGSAETVAAGVGPTRLEYKHEPLVTLAGTEQYSVFPLSSEIVSRMFELFSPNAFTEYPSASLKRTSTCVTQSRVEVAGTLAAGHPAATVT